MSQEKELLCSMAFRNALGCLGYGNKTFKAVIPCAMCKDCPEYVDNNKKENK